MGDEDSANQSDLYSNVGNMSLMNVMYTTTFGFGGFMVQPPSHGEVGAGFPSIPYLSLEAVFYQQQASNPLSSPVSILSGSNVGEQVIQGAYTSTDASGTTRALNGYQSSGSSSILNTSSSESAK